MSRRRRAQRRAEIPALEVIRCPLFAGLPWLVHGFTTRRGGVSRLNGSQARQLNLGNVSWDRPRNVLENRCRMQSQLRAEDMTLVTLRQIHSDMIRVVDSSLPAAGDGLITNRPGILLSIVAADCLPILVVDAKRRVVAAVHCGWRGTAKSIVQKAVGLMRMLFDSRPRDLMAAIGPGIRVCCYQVGPEVAEEFAGQFAYAQRILVQRNEPPDPVRQRYPRLFVTYKSPDYQTFHHTEVDSRTYLDLVMANVWQLRQAGLTRNHIYAEFPCTSCHPELFFSHRRDGGHTGRMMGVIGIRN